MSRKAQMWTLDLVAGITIFLVMVTIFLIFMNNITGQKNVRFDDLYTEAAIVSDSLLFGPINSSTATITNNDYRLDGKRLYNLSNMDYSQVKLALKTKYDFLIFFQNISEDVMQIDGVKYIGKSGVTKENIKESEAPKDIISIKRFLIYNSTIISMEVYLWQ